MKRRIYFSNMQTDPPDGAHPKGVLLRVAKTNAAQGTFLLAVMLVLMWSTLLATRTSGGALFVYGVVPRSFVGLRGILFAPFLHGSVAHLAANSVPLAILGWLVGIEGPRTFLVVTAWSMLGSGVAAWLLGNPGSIQIGASGVVLGYLGYLMASAWYTRKTRRILTAVCVILVWGGLLSVILPGSPAISWQAHLGGVAGGWIAARWYRAQTTA
jgi:membrane associated rhomboid family serine protease